MTHPADPVVEPALPRRSWAWRGAVAVQGGGALAGLAIGLLIAVTQGPAAQGRYGIVRAVADLLLTLGLFGFPQGLVHLINRGGIKPAALAAWGRRYLMAVIALGLVVLVAWPLDSTAPGDGNVSFWLLIGVVGWTAHGLQRSFVLCLGSPMRFAWLTVMPAVTMLMAVGLLIAVDSQRWDLALAASGVASMAAGSAAVLPLRRAARWSSGGDPRGVPLLAAGAQSFAQTLSLSLQVWLTLQLLRWHGVAVTEIGLFVFAAYVWQAFALPAGFISPLLFAQISAAGANGDVLAVGRRIRAFVWRTVLVSAAVALVLPLAVPALFGDRYAAAVGACVWLALGGPLVVFNRLGVAVLLGRGHFGAAFLQAVLRMLAVPTLLWVCLAASDAHAATLTALSWVLVEALAALALLASVAWRDHEPLEAA